MLFSIFINNHGDETKCDLWPRNTMMNLRTGLMENSWSSSRKFSASWVEEHQTITHAKQVAEYQLCQNGLGSNNGLIKINFTRHSLIHSENCTWPRKGKNFFHSLIAKPRLRQCITLACLSQFQKNEEKIRESEKWHVSKNLCMKELDVFCTTKGMLRGNLLLYARTVWRTITKIVQFISSCYVRKYKGHWSWVWWSSNCEKKCLLLRGCQGH